MKPIYLEPDEEITSVIDKLLALSDHQVAVVVPKNSTLFQSLINLKLLAKEAKSQGKEVVIISTNKVGQRLAGQVGLKAYNSLGTSAAATPELAAATPVSETLPDGIKVNLYQPGVTGEIAAVPAPVIEKSIDPVTETEIPAEPMPDQPVAVDEPVVETPKKSLVKEPKEPITSPETTPEPVEELPAVVNKPEKTTRELPPIISRGFTTRQEFVMPWKSLILASGLLLIGLIIVYLFLPKATLTVTFPAKSVNQALTLSAKTTVDDQASTVAGNLLSSQKEGQKVITATGKKDIGTKATGSVTITNKYRDETGAGRDQSFAAGTKLSDGKTKKIFTLDSAVSVGKVTYDPNTGQPIYKSASVKVTATEPGESYNIAPSSFSLNGALADTPVESTAAFSGGLTKQVTVLSQDDVDKVMAELKNQVQGEATAELKTKAAAQTLLDGSTWQVVKTETVDKKVGDQTDTATAIYSIEQSVIVFDPRAVEEKVRGLLAKDLTEQEELVIPETEPFQQVFNDHSADKTVMNFDVAAKGFIVTKINKTDVSKAVAHQPVDSVTQILADKFSATDAKVELTPGWWLKRLPLLSQAIKVEYGFDQETE